MSGGTQAPYAGSTPAIKVEPLDVGELSGVWVCKQESGTSVEITFTGDKYTLKVNGADNHSGVFSLRKVNDNRYVIFTILEKFDESIEWKRLHIRYAVEDEKFVLQGDTYGGTYTNISK